MLSSGIKKYVFFLVVLLLHTGCIASLQEKITQIISRKDQANVKFGIIIIEPCSGQRIFEYNGNLPLIPASNMKLITSFTALKFLGPQFEFVTVAAISGKNLVIIGSGDPLLGLVDGNDLDSNKPAGFISDIIGALKEKNITEIKDIVIDCSVFDDVRAHPNWPKEQLNRPYACEISGLNYNANCIKISASQKDGQIILATEPQTSYLEMVNKIQPVDKGDSAIGSYRTDKENVIIVHGKCRKTASFDVAIEKPPAFFGALLTENLNKAGIKTSGRLTIASVDPEKLQILVEHRTGIIKVIKQCNKDSFQLAAECLLKTLGARRITGGRAGSWQGGQKVLTDYLSFLGADEEWFYIDDGSGLSSQNKLTAGLIARVLADAYSSDLWPAFKDTLAAGGVDGTLKKYFYQSRYRGKVFAKTGYINSVRALSGVCTAAKKEYLFSILTNDANYKTKEAIFDIVKAIIDEG
jgi:D-alanyl-D-alanine carboxypeptidase/D-alanyl-D-alanine-endopeptidase (penicillin-binding protein 4)